jgi:hypothetical protein
MNKLLAGIIGAVAIVASADAALLSEGARKDACNKKEGFIWIENAANGKPACIAEHPCGDKDYEAYCNRIFADIEVSTEKHAKELMNAYLKKRSGAWCEHIDADKSHLVGQDYIRCKLNDGGYMEFEFDDYSESIESSADFGYAEGMCLVYGGKPHGMTKEGNSAFIYVSGLTNPAIATAIKFDDIAAYGSGKLLVCEGIQSAEICDEMYNGMAAWNEEKLFCAPHKSFIY